jgi:hypothetical protein
MGSNIDIWNRNCISQADDRKCLIILTSDLFTFKKYFKYLRTTATKLHSRKYLDEIKLGKILSLISSETFIFPLFYLKT